MAVRIHTVAPPACMPLLVCLVSEICPSRFVFELTCASFPSRLRGSKVSNWYASTPHALHTVARRPTHKGDLAVLFREGGVRGISFVSGGFLPEKQRGTHHQGYIHVCDWLATFS